MYSKYTGKALQTTQTPKRYEYLTDIAAKKIIPTPLIGDDEEALTEKIDPYFPDPVLVEAIELMEILQRPLLLRGEPGCGKTRVAQAYAYERYKDIEGGYRSKYFEWHVKSTSKAKDGLYQFDHIKRLRWANQTGQHDLPEEADDILKKYCELGPLGQAFLASEPGKPAVLLIDEIDKADIDFPNDLLLELDEMRFVIRESNIEKEIIPLERPIIFITSNQERELPQAFLRRCLFHFIKFPDDKQLKEIMLANFPELKTLKGGKPYTDAVITRFIQLRDELGKNPTANKNVSTSELKDWMKTLVHFYAQRETTKSVKRKKELSELLNVTAPSLPFHTALLKTENDLKSIGKLESKPK